MSTSLLRYAVAGLLALAGATPLLAEGTSAPFASSSPVDETLPAQEALVGGVVVDARSLLPIAGAQIVVLGTDLGGFSNASGRFLILGVSGTEVTLRVVMLGHRTLTQAVRVGSSDLRLALTVVAVELDELIVTGTAGGTLNRAIGNSVARVSGDEIREVVAVVDVQSILMGRAAGVDVISSTGNVGSGGVTRIRGVSSLTLSNEPLIYVDGIRVDNNVEAGPTDMRESRPVSRINDFNPEDIESIEIIKGPAAATLYGTEASNGVIQIITKKGSRGAPRFDFVLKQGANFFLNPEGRLNRSYRRSNAADTLEVLDLFAQEAERGALGACGRLFCNGHIQGFQGSVVGGTDLVRYYVSAAYDDQVGYVWYNNQEKLNVRANLGLVLSETLDINTSFGLITGKTRFAQAASPWGIWDATVWGHTDRTRSLGWYTAPGEELEKIESFENLDRVTWSGQGTWRPWSWMVHRLTLGTDISTAVNTRLFPRQPEGSDHFFGQLAFGDKRRETILSTYNTVDYSTTGTWDLNPDVSFATSFGVQYYSKRLETSFAKGRVFPVPGVESVGGTAVTTGFEDIIENKTFGLYIQEQLNWRDRVFITAAVRGDDNSAFGANFDFVTYPKLSASWVLTEEPFWNIDWVNTVKLRAAWGQAGQQPDIFAAVRLYTPATGPGDASVLTPENIGNPDLKPEKGEEIELGFDAGLFDDRVSLNFTYYNQRTKDAILERDLPLSLGFPGTQFVNAGEIKNTGVEIGIDAQILQRENLAWNVAILAASNSNEVIDLGGLPPLRTRYGETKEGGPVGGIHKIDIVSAEFDASGEPINIMCAQESGSPRPCEESAPFLFQGPFLPKWEGNLTSTLTLFNNLRLFGNLGFRTGWYRTDNDMGHSLGIIHNSQANFGYEDGRGPDPIVAAYNTRIGSWGRSLHVIKGGFWRLREISAVYALPDRWAENVGASRASIAVAGRNLWFMWRAEDNRFGRKSMDPELRRKTSLSTGTQTHLPPASTWVITFRFSL